MERRRKSHFKYKTITQLVEMSLSYTTAKQHKQISKNGDYSKITIDHTPSKPQQSYRNKI